MRATEVRTLVERRFDEYLETLRQMVDIDCGTFTPEGVNRIADRCEKEFATAGFEVDRRPHRPQSEGDERLGDLLIGSFEGQGRTRVLLIGHMDTVFPEGTAQERPFRIEGDRAFGPGVIDMKSGLLGGFVALDALREAGFDGFGRITYVCNPDEEIGSPFSKPVIRELARETDVCFVLEGGRENGNLVSARKGVADVVVDITGKAAHAGVNPDRGRSAIVEASHKVLALHELNGRWPGVTVNAGAIAGGTRANVVAEHCRVHVDVRSPHDETFDEALDEVRRIGRSATLDGITSTVEVRDAHRPFEKTEASGQLVGMAQEIARELGFEVVDQATGGASDGNTTAAEGVPTLDGLGPIGGDPHGPDEWLDLTSVVPRVSLLAALLARVCER